MTIAKTSECGRFVRLDELYVDKDVYNALERWSQEQQLQLQDAIQLALCAFNERHEARVLQVQDSAFEWHKRVLPSGAAGGACPTGLAANLK
jgi:hypothetical protein